PLTLHTPSLHDALPIFRRLPKTSHLWILSVSMCRSSIASFSLHKDQDQMNTYSFSVDGRYIFDFSMANDQVSHRLLDTFGKKDRDRKSTRLNSSHVSIS